MIAILKGKVKPFVEKKL